MTAPYSKSQGSENCVVGGEKKKAKKKNTIKWLCIVQGSTDEKKDWLKIKHITLFCCFNPKKSVVVLTVYNPYTIST